MKLHNGIDGRIKSSDIVTTIVYRTVFDVHWRSLRKMNSEYGAYGGYGGRTDTYTQVRQAGREVFHKFAEPLVNDIKKSFWVHATDDDVKAVTDSYLLSLDGILKTETSNMGEKFENWALKDGFYPQSDRNQFWNDVNGMRGRGYQRRVGDRYYIEVRDNEDTLTEMVSDGLKTIVNRLLDSMPKY